MRLWTPAVMAVSLFAVAGLPGVGQNAPVQFRDDFSGYAPGSDGSPRWLTHSIFWEVRNGAYAFDGRSPGFAVAGEEPNYRNVSLEATMTLHESHGDSWKVAGVAVYADAGNFWHLALVEAPQANAARHYVELSEMLKGEWLSQTRLRSTVREGAVENAWQYDTPYRMRMALTPDGIEGTISQAEGTVLHRLG